MCEVCAAGGLRELREEVKAARHTENKLVREVRRLEEQLLSRHASAKTRSQVETLAPGGGKLIEPEDIEGLAGRLKMTKKGHASASHVVLTATNPEDLEELAEVEEYEAQLAAAAATNGGA